MQHGDNPLGIAYLSVCPFVCLFVYLCVLPCLNHLTYDLDFLAWGLTFSRVSQPEHFFKLHIWHFGQNNNVLHGSKGSGLTSFLTKHEF